MYRWIILIIAVGFALLGYKKTLYPTWAFVFNIIVAVYLGVMTGPQIVDKLGIFRMCVGNFAYPACILAVAVIYFLIVQLFTFRFFTSVYCVSFPVILNKMGGAILGFWAGAVIAGFVLFLINISPLTSYSAINFFRGGKLLPQKANAVVYKTCNFVHSISLQSCPTSIAEQFEKISADWRQAGKTKTDSNSVPDKSMPIVNINTPPAGESSQKALNEPNLAE
ncbi:MAG: hypothetical protein PHP01_04240 [Phycisphaerae bacterium]|nr:hypothetical protein [Phycisphaerae bacterium]